LKSDQDTGRDAGELYIAAGPEVAKRNFVASTVSDQSSIIRFLEDNCNLGRIGDQAADDGKQIAICTCPWKTLLRASTYSFIPL
jgi:hypothetical protein